MSMKIKVVQLRHPCAGYCDSVNWPLVFIILFSLVVQSAQSKPSWFEEHLISYFPFEGDIADKVGIWSPATPYSFVKGVDGVYVEGVRGKAWFIDLNPLSSLSYQNDYEYYVDNKIEVPFNVSLFVRTSRNQTAAPETLGNTPFTREIHNLALYPYQFQNQGLGLAVGNNNISVYGHALGLYSRPLSYDVELDSEFFYHISINCYTNSDMSLFIDGELIKTVNTNKPFSFVPVRLGGSVEGGGWDNNEDNRFDGVMDELRVFNRTLSADEINELIEYDLTAAPERFPAEAVVQVINGFIVSVEIIDSGYGYLAPPSVQVVGGGGSGAKLEAIVVDGVLDEIKVINPGTGYNSTPELIISAPTSETAGAYAEATVVNGFVVDATVLRNGSGYMREPKVIVSGGGGQGAELLALVEDGQVVKLEVLNPGSGYTSTPLIIIAEPDRPPEIYIKVKTVQVDLRLAVGKSYEIYSSNNMSAWTLASTIVAENEFTSLIFDIDEYGKYYKIVELP